MLCHKNLASFQQIKSTSHIGDIHKFLEMTKRTQFVSFYVTSTRTNKINKAATIFQAKTRNVKRKKTYLRSQKIKFYFCHTFFTEYSFIKTTRHISYNYVKTCRNVSLIQFTVYTPFSVKYEVKHSKFTSVKLSNLSGYNLANAASKTSFKLSLSLANLDSFSRRFAKSVRKLAISLFKDFICRSWASTTAEKGKKIIFYIVYLTTYVKISFSFLRCFNENRYCYLCEKR